MEVRFADDALERLEWDTTFNAGFAAEIVRAYRMRMQFIRAAKDERDFYAWKSLHYEKLKGKRSHQNSMRLNKQWRLVLEIVSAPSGQTAVIISIEDYH